MSMQYMAVQKVEKEQAQPKAKLLAIIRSRWQYVLQWYQY